MEVAVSDLVITQLGRRMALQEPGVLGLRVVSTREEDSVLLRQVGYCPLPLPVVRGRKRDRSIAPDLTLEVVPMGFPSQCLIHVVSRLAEKVWGLEFGGLSTPWQSHSLAFVDPNLSRALF